MGQTRSNRVRIALPSEKVADFARRWGVTEFALFGSVLRDDFRPDSDVDVLVTFAAGTKRSLGDWINMQDELTLMFGRPVDLVDRESIERSLNWYRKTIILESAEVLYAA
jgi:predicted nucleotidyltransferase